MLNILVKATYSIKKATGKYMNEKKPMIMCVSLSKFKCVYFLLLSAIDRLLI